MAIAMHPDLQRSVNAARAGAAGKAWEKLLEDHHDMAIKRGLLICMDKQQSRKVPKRVRGQVVYRDVEAHGADWIGMRPGGRYVALEAKSIADARLPLDALTDKQRKHLNLVAAGGGQALLAVEFRSAESRRCPGTAAVLRCVIPWEQVPWRMVRTAKAVYAEDCAAWEITQFPYLAAECLR